MAEKRFFGHSQGQTWQKNVYLVVRTMNMTKNTGFGAALLENH